MAIGYVAVKKKVRQMMSGVEGPITKDAYFPVAKSFGNVNTEQIAASIAERCTAQRPDVEAVLSALQIVIRQQLLNGVSVKLSQLGTFRLTLKGLGAATADAYELNLIERINFRFIPVTGNKTPFKKGAADLKFVPWAPYAK